MLYAPSFQEGILLLIEPLNSDFVIKNYFLDREAKGEEYVDGASAILSNLIYPNWVTFICVSKLGRHWLM